MENLHFFKSARSLLLSELPELLPIRLAKAADGRQLISAAGSLITANADAVTYITDKKYLYLLNTTRAKAVFCRETFLDKIPDRIAPLISREPYQDFIKLTGILYPEAVDPTVLSNSASIADKAIIDSNAKIDPTATIEAGAIIGACVQIAAGSFVASGTVIRSHCKIGKNCYIGPNVTIQYAIINDNAVIHPGCRIGQDGFGFTHSSTGLLKVPHLGAVIIGKHVEIGANTTIDRGSFSDTIIGDETKIDNLVHIAHNVHIGRQCLIAAHSGIAGSVVIKDGAILGGRVGLKDHITIGEGAQLAASSGVMHDVPDHAIWGGLPARPIKQWLREVAWLRANVKVKHK